MESGLSLSHWESFYDGFCVIFVMLGRFCCGFNILRIMVRRSWCCLARDCRLSSSPILVGTRDHCGKLRT